MNLKVMTPTEEELKNHDGCCMCFEDGYTLDKLTESDNSAGVIGQAKLLMEMGYKDTDKFCEECFWK